MDFKSINAKWQNEWKATKSFEAKRDPSKKKFLITTPYPYISGSLHAGHGRVATEADVYARYLRMTGLNVCFPIAFHISGTPVLGISTAIEKKDPKKIELYQSYVRAYVKDEIEVIRIVESFKDPWNIVNFFVPKMIDEFRQLGVSMDFTRAFTSGDTIHQKLVAWQFNHYFKKGFIKKEKYPVIYSLEYKNAVAEDDITDGDTNPVDKQEFVLLKFRLQDPALNAYLVAGTLRPETMFGQTNLWVNPDIEYAVCHVVHKQFGIDENWIVSQDCVVKLNHQNFAATVKSTIKGSQLIGKSVVAPVIRREIPILPSSFCNPDVCTGIVTSVPSDAPFDFIALKEIQKPGALDKYHLPPETVEHIRKIKQILIIDTKDFGNNAAEKIVAKYKINSLDQKNLLKEATQELYKTSHHTGVMGQASGEYAGKSVSQTKEAIKQKLFASQEAALFWETSRIAVDRSGGKVIVAILDDQWFLDFNANGWKDLAYKALQHAVISPEKYRKQFEDVFDWLEKRPCARRRGLGTQLPMDPQWVIESLSDSTMYMTLYAIQQSIQTLGIDPNALNDAALDYIFLHQGNVSDVSKLCGISTQHLIQLHEDFAYWYPVDHRHSFQAHLPNHLSFMLFAHAAIFPENNWPKKISFHGLVISEGSKMSKSKGNVVTLLDACNAYGADAVRAYICHSTTVDQTLNWEASEVEKMTKHLDSIYTMLSEIVNQSSRASLHDPSLGSTVSKLHRAISRANDALASMSLRDYATIVLYEMPSLYKVAKRKVSADGLSGFSRDFAKAWITMLAPLAPHMAEELHAMMGERTLVSLQPFPSANLSLIDERAEFKEDLIDEVVFDIRNIKELAKLEKISKITLIVSPAWKYDFYRMMKAQLEETRDPKVIIASVMSGPLKQYGNQIMKLIPALLKDASKMPLHVLDSAQETVVLEQASTFIGKMFDCVVEIRSAEKFEHPKTTFASPAKPAIVLE